MTLDLGAWTHENVETEVAATYDTYSRALDAHYTAYFAANQNERGMHPRQARDLACALPRGWETLADELSEKVRHRHHLSGRSSQVLMLAAFGASGRLDPSLAWLFTALAPLRRIEGALQCLFELELPSEALKES